MDHTETYFGLENHDGKITADSGETHLPLYNEMTQEDFSGLIFDIENWIEKELSENEINDLIEILK